VSDGGGILSDCPVNFQIIEINFGNFVLFFLSIRIPIVFSALHFSNHLEILGAQSEKVRNLQIIAELCS